MASGRCDVGDFPVDNGLLVGCIGVAVAVIPWRRQMGDAAQLRRKLVQQPRERHHRRWLRSVIPSICDVLLVGHAESPQAMFTQHGTADMDQFEGEGHSCLLSVSRVTMTAVMGYILETWRA